jgi:ech hydrogenase subunit A
MELPVLLIVLPMVCGIVIASIKKFDIRKYFVFASSLLLAILAIVCVVQSAGALPVRLSFDSEWPEYLMLVLELGMAVMIGVLAIKYKNILALLLALIQGGLLIFFEVNYGGTIAVKADIVIDQLTIIMLLSSVSSVGSSACSRPAT